MAAGGTLIRWPGLVLSEFLAIRQCSERSEPRISQLSRDALNYGSLMPQAGFTVVPVRRPGEFRRIVPVPPVWSTALASAAGRVNEMQCELTTAVWHLCWQNRFKFGCVTALTDFTPTPVPRPGTRNVGSTKLNW